MILDIIQIVAAILLIIVVLLQNKGASIGAAFGGGEGNVNRSKRGAEKGLFYITIILAVIFLGTALIGTIF